MIEVKDQLTGKKRPKNELYQADNGKYYTSKEKYEEYKKNMEYRDKCTEKMYELINYSSFMKIPTFWYKRLKDWEDYGYEIVYMTIVDLSDILRKYAYKGFKSEAHRINYLSAIIENHLNDTLKLVEERKRVEKLSEENKGGTIEIENRKQPSKDISKFIEEE